MVLLESAVIYLFATFASIALHLMTYVTVIALLAQCKPRGAPSKKEIKSPKQDEPQKKVPEPAKPKSDEAANATSHAKGSADNENKKPQAEKIKKGNEGDEDEEKQVVEDIKPKRIARNAKEERIAKGKEMRGKGDYPTMDDVLSDWDSEKDGKKENSKANDDLETRTNLEDADDERPSKSAMDQAKKPDSQVEEPVEKNNDEVPIAKEIKAERYTEKDAQMDDTQRTEKSRRKDKNKSLRRLLKSAKEKCGLGVMKKQRDLSEELEVCMTQTSPVEKGSLKSQKGKASSIGTALEKREQQYRKKTPLSIPECATQQTRTSTQEGDEHKRLLTIHRVSSKDSRRKVTDTPAANFQGELIMKATEKADQGGVNGNSGKDANNRASISKGDSSEKDGSAKQNKQEEDREASRDDDETPKQTGTDVATSDNVQSACSSERRKDCLQTGKAAARKMVH